MIQRDKGHRATGELAPLAVSATLPFAHWTLVHGGSTSGNTNGVTTSGTLGRHWQEDLFEAALLPAGVNKK
jgi:hypothetical protein